MSAKETVTAEGDRFNKLMAGMLTIVLLVGMAVGFLIGREHPSKERTESVRRWAEGAYEVGYADARWVGISKETRENNKKFAVDAVVDAHKGAWKK